jgi:hypothetical protein
LTGGKIFFKKNKNQAVVTYSNVNNLGYFIYNNPIPHNRRAESRLYVKVDGQIIRHNNRNVFFHPKSRVYIEGSKIELIRPNFEKNDARLTYNSISNQDKNKVLKGTWGFNGSNGPTLLLHMKKPRNIRLRADTFEPKITKFQHYEFTVIVDGVTLYPNLSNWSSVDVYGKQVIIALASWPPSATGLYIKGSYEIF